MFKHILVLLLLVPTMLFAVTVHVADPETWTTSALTQYAGQTVTFDVPMYICNNGGWSGGNFAIGPRRVFAPTNVADPGSLEYTNIVTLNKQATISVSGIPTDNGKTRRTGVRIQNLTVKLDATGQGGSYISGSFVGNSREDLVREAQQRFPDLYDHRDSINVLVCGMNLEYYLTDYSSFSGGYNSSTQGPHTVADHQKQRAKVNDALSAINADVYGLVEIQKGDGALREIAEDLTSKTGRQFDYVSSGTSQNGTFTQSGFVYCAETVEPAARLQKVTAAGGSFADRMVMMLFRIKSNGGTFIYSINHYKAKSGSGTGADMDQGDGQGGYNATRTGQARQTYEKYTDLTRGWHEKDILLMGDLNAYGHEDPIRALTSKGMTDLHRHYHADTSYSYTFGGQAGYLDHAIVNSTMLRQVKGMQAYHINSDEHDNYTYDSSNDLTRFRCSDHDPVLVGLYIRPEGQPHDEEPLYDRLVVNYYRIYTLQGGLVYEGQDYELPSASGIYIVVKYGTDPVRNNAAYMTQRKVLVP